MREIVALSLVCLSMLGWSTTPVSGQAPIVAAASVARTMFQPSTPKSPVTDVYHDVPVTEDYRWLEAADSPAVQQWTAAQKHYARQTLDNLPHADAIRKQVTEILSAETVSYSSVTHRNGRFFATKQQPPKQQPFIVVVDSLAVDEVAGLWTAPPKIQTLASSATGNGVRREF